MKKLLSITLLAIMASFVTVNAQTFLGYVSDPDGYVNIRSSASSKASIIGTYSSGEYLYYTPLKSGWSEVYSDSSSDSFLGYIHTSRIVRVGAEDEGMYDYNETGFEQGYIVDPKDNYVNVRKGPGTKYGVACRLEIGTTVYFNADPKSKWVEVYDENMNYLGYIYRNRISQHL